MKDKLVRIIYRHFLPPIVWLLYRSLVVTWRIKIYEPESLKEVMKNQCPYVLAHWHGDELALISQVSRYSIATITSTSVDGDLMDRVIRLLGGKTVRGSSTRGGITALKGLLRLIKEDGCCTSFAVDGPKGPLHKAKPGVFEVSRFAKAPIFPGGVFCDRAWRFPRSWNQTYMPKPFAKIQIYWGNPLIPVTKGQDPHSQELAITLENALHYCREQAEGVSL